MNTIAAEALYLSMPRIPHDIEKRYINALQRECTMFVNKYCDYKGIFSIFIAGDPALYRPYGEKHPLLDTLGILRIVTLATAEISLAVTCPPSCQEAAVWQKGGINRLHCVIQSHMKDVWLLYLRTNAGAAALPLRRLSVDITLDNAWSCAELQSLVAAGIQHISISFEEEIDESVSIASYETLADQLIAAGYEQYSAYDFALPGYRSVQQEVYMNGRPYQGFGLGACSFDGTARSTMTDSAETYCEALESGDPERALVIHRLTPHEQERERVVLRLMGSGILQSELLALVSHEKYQLLVDEIQRCQKAGLIEYQGDMLVLTVRGHLVENEVIRKILNYC